MNPETPVESVMTREPVVLHPEDSVAEALNLLERHPFRHLPVTREKELVGIVSDRDLAFAAALPRGKRAPGHGARRPVQVDEILHRDVRTLRPAAPVLAALETMLEHRVGALPVVSHRNLLLGIVTQTDFLRLLERGESWRRGTGPDEATVESCMSRPVLTASPGEDLQEAAERLLSSHVRHLPVVDGKKLVGMLSDRDVRRGLARLVREDRAIEAQGEARVPTLIVDQVMTRPCRTIARDGQLRAAARMLIEARISALPVTEGDELIGIVSQTDLLAHVRERSALRS